MQGAHLWGVYIPRISNTSVWDILNKKSLYVDGASKALDEYRSHIKKGTAPHLIAADYRGMTGDQRSRYPLFFTLYYVSYYLRCSPGVDSRQNARRNQSIVTGCTILACHASVVTIGKVASNVAIMLSWCRHHNGGIVAGTLYKRRLKAWGEASYVSALTVQARVRLVTRVVCRESAPALSKDQG